ARRGGGGAGPPPRVSAGEAARGRAAAAAGAGGGAGGVGAAAVGRVGVGRGDGDGARSPARGRRPVRGPAAAGDGRQQRQPARAAGQHDRRARDAGPAGERAGGGRGGRRPGAGDDGSAAVIPKITRGGNTRGLLLYLIGKGRREEHVDPRLVAGSAEAMMIAGGRVLEGGARDAAQLARFLDEPRETFGTQVRIAERDPNGKVVGSRDAHVWHTSLSLHPDEPALSDERWGEIAERFISEMGFAGDTARAQCRWVAVRHGESTGWWPRTAARPACISSASAPSRPPGCSSASSGCVSLSLAGGVRAAAGWSPARSPPTIAAASGSGSAASTRSARAVRGLSGGCGRAPARAARRPRSAR